MKTSGCRLSLLLLFLCSSASAFHMHKLMAAALLANSFQRNSYLPLPIPIPIPVKAGGNTIIALGPDDDKGPTIIPIRSSGGCHRPPCFYGHSRRDDFW